MSKLRASGKDLRDLLRKIEAAGARVEQARRNAHWKIFVDDKLVVVISSTCGHRSAYHDVLRDLRHAGLNI
jgi:hypothetical protein